MSVAKVRFTLPEELVRRLEKVPAGKRSMLVKEAVEEDLDRAAALAMLKKMKGTRSSARRRCVTSSVWLLGM